MILNFDNDSLMVFFFFFLLLFNKIKGNDNINRKENWTAKIIASLQHLLLLALFGQTT